MRLIELNCDQPGFHNVRFNREGLTLIVGDGSQDRSEGSSNGVGKTLAMGLVHHCLGANTDARLKRAVPEWTFGLIFEHNSDPHAIERTGDGRTIRLDGASLSLTKLREWLNESGIFRFDPPASMFTFRSLFKRFARYRREDCLDPLKTDKEYDFDGRLRSLYLLGLEWTLAISKRDHKLALDSIAVSLKNWANDDLLKDMFRAGAQPKLRAEWLEREIPRLRGDLERFKVAEDYRAIELSAGELTRGLREIENHIAVLDFQRQSIEQSLALHPDISKGDLLELYDGILAVFKPEALAHFDAVEEFHLALATTRRVRLEGDLANLTVESNNLENQRQKLAIERDEKLRSLHGKRALDEYSALASQLAQLQEEHDRLSSFLSFSSNLQQRALTIKERRVEEDRAAANYLAANPIAQADEYFTGLAQLMYPRSPSGIVLENNTGDNQLRYDIAVQIEGDDSDGINAARILCFDWLLMLRGANHTMDFLWHDNRLFADVDPRARAAWFSNCIAVLPGTGKQYIASLNTENYDAMGEYLTDDQRKMIDRAVVVTLRGDLPENKLLGVQFGA